MIRSFLTIASTLTLAACMSQAPVPAVDRNAPLQSRTGTQVTQPSGPGYYTVKRGDNLYRIALDNGQDHRDIAAWNNITNINAIKEGQVLRIAPPNAVETSGTVVANPVASGPVVESRSLDAAPVAVVVAPNAVSATPANGNLKREPKVGKEPYSDEAYARLNNASEAPKSLEPKPEVKPEAVAVAAPSAGPDDVVWAWPSSGRVVVPFGMSGNKGIDINGKFGDSILAAADGRVTYVGSSIKGYGNFIVINHKSGFNTVYAHNRKILVKETDQVTRGQKIAEMGNSDTDVVKLHFELRKQGKPLDPASYLPNR
jgi:lipoprotein NlpD